MPLPLIKLPTELSTLAFWRFTLIATALCALHLWLALDVAERTGMTCDEIAHITAGLTYNERGDFRLHPENGNLPQRIHGLAVELGTGAQLPPISHPEWIKSNVWYYGHDFFFKGEVPPGLILLHARAANLIWSLALGLMILLWSRRLGGDLAGLAALALWAAEPAILAHGSLATSDMCATFWLTATCGLWWRALARTTWSSVLAVGLSLGLCAIAKFSVLILGPALGLIAAVWLKGQIGNIKPALARLAFSAGAAAITALLIIWTAYGFRQSIHNTESSNITTALYIDSADLEKTLGTTAYIVKFTKGLEVVPDAFLYGLTYVLTYSKARAAFLDGSYSITGWWDFFPRAFFYKTSPALLLGLLLALIAAVRVRLWRNCGPSILVLGSLVTVYALISMGSSLNIGHRHLLPIYPALFIAAGWGLSQVTKNIKLKSLAALITLSAASVSLVNARTAPLTWFSPLIGGSSMGWKHLGDSSLDWGQGLPALADWWFHQPRQDRVRVPLYLSYFGNDEPANYGLKHIPISYFGGHKNDFNYYELKPGWYAFGATMLQKVYSPVRGPWSLAWESEYQYLRRFRPTFSTVLAQNGRPPEGFTAESIHQLWYRFKLLQDARLCHYLKERKADIVLDNAMFIYSLTAQDITDYTERSASTLPLSAWE